MSFHFQRIRLKDWLVYGGDTEINLPDFEDSRNLVIFNGENGFGKTSLLQALIFVFNRDPTKDELLEWWNERARQTKEGSLEVGLEFSHAGRTCMVVRGASFKPRRNTVSVSPWVKLIVDGSEEKDQVEDKIGQLLPRDCLEFVFFDGAEISRYVRKQHDAGVREAIEKVLGIPAFRNLRDDLGKVIDDLETEQQRLLTQSQKAKNIVAEIESKKDEIAGYESRRDELADKKQSLEESKTMLEKEADGIDAIKKDQEDLAEKQRRRADREERRQELWR